MKSKFKKDMEEGYKAMNKTAKQVNDQVTGSIEKITTEATNALLSKDPSAFSKFFEVNICNPCRQQIRAEVCGEIEKLYTSECPIEDCFVYSKCNGIRSTKDCLWWQEFKRGVAQEKVKE